MYIQLLFESLESGHILPVSLLFCMQKSVTLNSYNNMTPVYLFHLWYILLWVFLLKEIDWHGMDFVSVNWVIIGSGNVLSPDQC